MDLAGIRRRVQGLVGDTAGVFVGETVDIDDWANDAQLEIVRFTEILRTTALITSVAGTAEYSVNANFIVEKRVTYLYPGQTNPIRLKRISLEELDYLDPYREVAGGQGDPSHYYVLGSPTGTIGLYPVPQTGVTSGIRVTYVRTPATLVNPADVPEIPTYMHNEIVRLAAAKAKEKDEDWEAARIIEQDAYARLAIIMDEAKNASAASYPAIRDLDAMYINVGWY